MKWVFVVVVLVYMFYRSVYGFKMPVKKIQTIKINTNSESGEVYILPGSRRALTCSGSSPYQKIHWINPNGDFVTGELDKRVFEQPQRYQSANSVTLLNITSASVDDSGVWVCQSENLVQNVSICVIGPTDFGNTSAEVSAQQGRSFTLSCHVKGEIEPEVTWFRNGEELIDDENTRYSIFPRFYQGNDKASLLTISSLTTSDSGVYTCNATQQSFNSDLDCVSTDSFDITLNVKYGPVFKQKENKKKVYGKEGKIIELECEAEGYPQPEYYWFDQDDHEYAEEDIIVSEDGQRSMLIVKVDAKTYEKEYFCKARNEVGEQDMMFEVLRPTQPVCPDNIEQVTWTNHGIILNLNWTQEIYFDIGDVEVQYLMMAKVPKSRSPKDREWRRALPISVPFSDIGDHDMTVSLNNLEENTEYWLRARVSNDKGFSGWSEPFIVFTKENEEEVESDTEEDQEQKLTLPVTDDSGKFYGFFFVGGVLLVAVACTLVAKMV